jgi:hypothetical protein
MPLRIECKCFSLVDFWDHFTSLMGMTSGKFALVIATNAGPPNQAFQDHSYNAFLRNMRTPTPPLEGVETLAENVWQIDIDSGLNSLARIIQEAKTWSIPLRVLFFETAPDWSKCPPSVPPTNK